MRKYLNTRDANCMKYRELGRTSEADLLHAEATQMTGATT
jgi:hypothetical protein